MCGSSSYRRRGKKQVTMTSTLKYFTTTTTTTTTIYLQKDVRCMRKRYPEFQRRSGNPLQAHLELLLSTNPTDPWIHRDRVGIERRSAKRKLSQIGSTCSCNRYGTYKVDKFLHFLKDHFDVVVSRSLLLLLLLLWLLQNC